jgi:hypothetical protein
VVSAFEPGFFKDMHVYNTDIREWKDLTSDIRGSIPAARSHFGISSVGEFLYLFGGWSAAGKLLLVL